MNSATQHWIPVSLIEPLIALEPFVLLLSLSAGAWIFYRIFLKQISVKRHTNLKKRFLHLAAGALLSSGLAAVHWWLRESSWIHESHWSKISAYLSLAALLIGAIAVVRLAQVLLYLYLFLVNMSVGVPRLIANTFSLGFATLVFGWIAAEVFGVRIAPLLATSAIFSIILGLALQETLGNFFSGVALQLDKPYGIGDWIEIQNGNQKWVGQIQEISWRATLLMGYSDELITIPNRTMSQSQVMIFSHPQKPPRRSQTFRFAYDIPVEDAKRALLSSLAGIPQILTEPAPSVLITETGESWITMKLFYSIEDFGIQYRVGDRVISQALETLRRERIPVAHPTLLLANSRFRG